jgi:hypothetical protein
MKKAAVGFRVHSGWSAVVAVCVEAGAPAVLHRERVHLVEEFTYRLRQPYHTAKKMPLAQAREFVSRVQATARDMAYGAIGKLRLDLEQRGYKLGSAALLLASGRPLPELERILASHAMIHTADGELFREALTRASVRCGLQVMSVKEKELAEEAAQSFGLTEVAVLKRITELGRQLRAPWSQDEKYSALGAWLALSDGIGCRKRTQTGKRGKAI